MSESKGINKKLNKNENASNLEYKRRIHVVQDYMEEHLDPPLTLETLSNVAGFSKYHFSRIFQGIIQEPLVHYVNRIRMERALFLLAHREDKSITDIAFEIGIQDSAVFSRAFKNYCGTSLSTYRKDYSKNCKESFLLSSYNKNAADTPLLNEPTILKVKTPWNESVIPNGGIVLENLVEKQLFYVRHTGTYETLEKEYGAAWDYMYREWITGSGYVPRDQVPFEVYRKIPEDGCQMHEVDIYLPVEPISF